MSDLANLSRRERQIMEVLYARGPSTALEVQSDVPNAPGDMAIRRFLKILEDKGHVVHKRVGRENVYRAKQPKQRVAKKALSSLLDVFFEGCIDNALATHLAKPGVDISDEQFERMLKLIEDARESRNPDT